MPRDPRGARRKRSDAANNRNGSRAARISRRRSEYSSAGSDAASVINTSNKVTTAVGSCSAQHAEETVESQPMSSSSANQTVGSSRLADAIAVMAVGLSTTGQAISMATLIFAGSLDAALPRAVASFCVAGGVLAIYIALRSRIVPAQSIIQDAPAIVLVAVASGIVAGDASADITDVFAMLMVTTLTTGVVMWLIGRLRLGGLVRYMPATVIGAFMAGTGWLLVKGGLDVMVGFGVGLDNIADLFTSDLLKFWIPGFLIGGAATLIGRSDRFPPAAIGGTVLLCTLGFYVVVILASSVKQVEDDGWLIGPFPDGAGPRIVTPAELGGADWSRILGELPGLVSVIAVSMVVVLLNLTGIVVATSERVDVDAELRTTGQANILVSIMGAAPGFHGLGDTLLLQRLSVTRRIVPVASGVFMILFGLIGVAAIGYVPRLIVGGLLVMVGSALLIDWALEMFHTVSVVERVLSIAILAIIASVGVLEGIGAGLVAACAVFIVRYSRVNPIRFGGTNPAMRSRVDRSPAQVQILRGRAERLAVFELQGYLFFGSLTKLEDRFHGSAADRSGAVDEAPIGELDAVVFDFDTVTGMDTSGYALIGQLVAHLHDRGSLVVLSALDDDLRRSLTAAVPSIEDHVAWAPTLDHALELSENAQLDIADDESYEESPLELLGDLLDVLDEVDYEAGEVVVEQGADSDGMLIIEDGIMTAFRVDGHGRRHRLRRFGTGAMVGEIGLITGGQRSAEVIAETDVFALWLSNERYQELRSQEPDLIFVLHEFIMRGQAARMISLSDGLARSRA